MLTAVVFLDVSKEFDSINHKTLILKLQEVVASNSVTQWFQCSLNDRRQVVRNLSKLTEPYLSSAVYSGVPQGSILGPVVFSIYTNGLPSKPQECSCQSYVDDNQLIISFQMKDINSNAFADLRNDLHRIGEWCSNNLLLLNPGKTRLMVFRSMEMR